MNKANKVVLITGASRGIGAQIATDFAKNGYDVAINYHTNECQAQKTLETVLSLDARGIIVRADVSDYNQVYDMYGQIMQKLGPVGMLINNAGIAQQKVFSDITEDDWDNMFAVNCKGVFNCCRAVLPYMIKEKLGTIINISSIWGISGASCEVHYSSAKSAVIGFTKALAKEVAPSNVRVNCIAPGAVETGMLGDLSQADRNLLKAQTPLGTIGTPSDISQTALFLASPAAKFITGQVISPNGGIVI